MIIGLRQSYGPTGEQEQEEEIAGRSLTNPGRD